MKFSLFILGSLLIMTAGLPAGEKRETQGDILSADERLWLEERGDAFLVSSPVENYAPISYWDEKGRLVGIAVDYLDLITEKTGLEVKRDTPATWTETLALARDKKIDIINEIQQTPDRDEYLLFSEPYIDITSVIIVRDDIVRNLSLDEMKDYSVGVTKGYSLEEHLRREYSEIQLVPLPSVEHVLQELSLGRIDAAVANLAVASWIIDSQGLSNLRIAGHTDYSIEIRLAVRDDMPILRNILNAGLEAITPEERAAIYSKWISLEIRPFYANPAFYVTLLVAFLLIAVSMVWNTLLRREVQKRRIAEKNNRKLIQELEASLAKIKTLSGLVPICANCKRIRDDKGYWGQLEQYIESHTEALFSHGICPECQEKIYGDKKWYKDRKKKE